ncbi:hypothetical protein Q6D67_12975 [Haliea sp. E1-2-M8]|uniref:hypothetical protein n=1 Tax=Haliea sp. E1-2-M8 TaxID=3064706 RepID=UPI00271D7E0D|nr:hypothetical protein [Haliea sp. E1-2-M8]MDO8862616.1 hypothetical protein [Haliea sp. E1-2-M8]
MGRPLAVILILLLAGCGASQPSAPLPEPEPGVNPLVQCSSPRPQVCTMEYNPVCAQLADGTVSVYSSPCNACADDSVTGYLPGACADE